MLHDYLLNRSGLNLAEDLSMHVAFAKVVTYRWLFLMQHLCKIKVNINRHQQLNNAQEMLKKKAVNFIVAVILCYLSQVLWVMTLN